MRWPLHATVVILCLGLALRAVTGSAAHSFPLERRCAVTPYSSVPAPTPSPGDGYDPYPPGALWYRSDDGRLWMHPWDRWHAGRDGIKVFWLKPAGSRLSVSGRRLDRHAPPMRADIPNGYPGDYQASGLFFPTAGCWVIRAHAAGSHMRVIVRVAPA